MARIRTTKPEFWTDDDMLELSDSCALFFIALWNFCDDEGKIKNQPRTISKLTGRWSAEKVKSFTSFLVNDGKLRLSSCSAWLQVVNWSHQKINRPIQPKVKSSDIQWVTNNDSVSPHGSFTEHSPQGEDRIGKEGIGDSTPIVPEGKKAIEPYVPEKEISTPAEAFEYLKGNYIIMENAMKTMSGKGWRTADEVDIVGMIKVFVSAKAKMDQPPEEMARHFKNWIYREPVKNLTEIAANFKKTLV